MSKHYFLWAGGKDRPGVVASVAKVLFDFGGNLEDSSMMRLGGEFGIFLIFSSTGSPSLLHSSLEKLKRNAGLDVGLREISQKEARFVSPKNDLWMVSAHGPDMKGLVYKLTALLARHRFNITDMSTHRTSSGKSAGYILLVEGELSSKKGAKKLATVLKSLGSKLGMKISLNPVMTHSL